MSPTRLIILGVGFFAAIIAAVLAVNLTSSAPETIRQVVRVPTIETSKILVTKRKLKRGEVVNEGDVLWAEWPSKSITEQHLTEKKNPKAVEEFVGRTVRHGMEAGDPAYASKFIAAGEGFMASVLSKGKRAVSTNVSPGTAAGGFILPDDRVDVMMTRTISNGTEGGADEFRTEPVLTNVRVLAIDQVIEEQDGTPVVVGKTATLELSDEQVRILTVAQQVADRITLALRSLRDADEPATSAAKYLIGDGDDGKAAGTVSVFRYGNRSIVKAK